MLSEVSKVVVLSVAFKALVGSGAATLPKSEAKGDGFRFGQDGKG